MGRFKRFKLLSRRRRRQRRSEDLETEASSKRETTEDSWNLLDYPSSLSLSDDNDDGMLDLRKYTTLKHQKAAPRPSNTMPLEHTQYSIHSSEFVVARESVDVGWGASFVDNVYRVSGVSIRSLLVSDLQDHCLFEKAGIQCGDVILKINSEDIARWTHEEMLEELDLHLTLHLTVMTNKQQQTKYILFLDLSPVDILNIWALNNLVSLHICGTKLKNGIVDLSGVSCKSVLQELAVTKSELDSVTGIKGLEKFSKLKRLNLTHNRICELDEDVFRQLQNLEELRLGNNNIGRFPLVVTELPLLRDLSLVYNVISSIPEYILKMTCLECLHLDNNYLSELPEFVTHQLPSLRCLTFANNQLSWEESTICDLFHLELIDFSENGTRARIGMDTFGNLTGRATLRRKGRNKGTSLLRMALNSA